MATNIKEVNLLCQRGNGVPSHVSNKSTIFFDLDTAIIYINKDGGGNWDYILDSSMSISGGTSSGDTYVTGFTYDNSNNLTLHRNDGVNLTTNFSVFTGLTATTISATTYYGNGSNLTGISGGSGTDTYVTGGTFNQSTRVATFTNSTGGTFSVSGFNDSVTTGATTNNSTKQYTFTNSTGGTFVVSGLTDINTTGVTFTNNLLSVNNNTGGTNTVLINTLTGLTVNGVLSATTISAATYYGNGSNLTGLTIFSESTGVFYGGVGSVSGGTGSGTTINLTAGAGQIFNNTTSASTYTRVSWSAYTNVSLVTTGTQYTYWYIDVSGILNQTTTAPTRSNYRTRIWLFRTSFTGGFITGIADIFVPVENVAVSMKDLNSALGPIRVSGAAPTFSGANLKLKITSGEIYDYGTNLGNDLTDPNVVTVPTFDTGVANTFRYTTTSGSVLTDITNLIPSNYQVGGVVTGIPGTGTRTSIQYIVGFQGGLVRVLYGNDFYNDTTEALKALLGNDPYDCAPPAITSRNSFVLGAVIAPKNATDLSTQGTFVTTNRFGAFGGSALSTALGSDVYVTGFTYSNNLLTIKQNQNQSDLSVLINTMTGLTATTISATTYYNIPDVFGVSIDGMGGVIVTGITNYKVMTTSGTITGWNIISSVTGSVVFDIWKSTGGTLPTVVNTITDGNKPQLSGSLYSASTSVNTWGKTFSAGDIMGFNIDSVSGITKGTLTITYLKS